MTKKALRSIVTFTMLHGHMIAICIPCNWGTLKNIAASRNHMPTICVFRLQQAELIEKTEVKL